MRKTRIPVPVALLVVALLSVGLCACGGSDDDSTETTAAPREAGPTAATGRGEADGEGGDQAGAEGAGGDAASAGGGPASDDGDERPASLATDPDSIPRAIVTGSGAVQTLPPNPASQAQAMENSYSSIKAFGEESEGSEATDITFALVQYLTAKASGDWATACARIYTPLREDIANAPEAGNPVAQGAGGGCPGVLRALLERTSRASRAAESRIDVASVRRGDGNRAFVIYKTADTLSADMPMYLDGGVWTVAAIQAYVLTPEQLRENQ